jgi:hypothetical protein
MQSNKPDSKIQTLLSRRNLLQGGLLLGSTCYVGAGLNTLNPLGRLLPINDLAMAQTATPPAIASPVLVHFVLIDKVQASLFQKIDGTPAPGSESGDGVAQAESDFRGMGLTRLFGEPLKALPENIAVSINNTWESGSNGHSLTNSNINQAFGSVNHAFETLSQGTGMFGPIGFSIRSDANDSQDAFLASGGRPLKTFDNVNQLANTIEQSLSPLQKIQNNKNLVQALDGIVTSDKSIRDALGGLLEKAGNVTTELESSNMNQNPIETQVSAVISMYKAGLGRNFMIAVPWDDTNSGGNLTSTGGAFNLDPFSATPKIAAALVTLHQNIPNLICVSTSDGGRSQDNGDRSAGFSFMTGPNTVVKNGVIGGKFTSTNQLGQRLADAELSSGVSQPTRPQNWYATALQAASKLPGQQALSIAASVPFVAEAIA